MTESPSTTENSGNETKALIDHYMQRISPQVQNFSLTWKDFETCSDIHRSLHPNMQAMPLYELPEVPIPLMPYAYYSFFPQVNPSTMEVTTFKPLLLRNYYYFKRNKTLPTLAKGISILQEIVHQEIPHENTQLALSTDNLESAKIIESDFAIKQLPSMMMTLNIPEGASLADPNVDIFGLLHTTHGISPQTGLSIMQTYASGELGLSERMH